MQGKSPAQLIGMTFGIVYLLVGAVGFAVTGVSNFATDTSTQLIIFDLNPLHNIVHLAIGAALLGASASSKISGPVNGVVGATYIAVALIGLTGILTFISVNSGPVPDFFLHLASGLVLVAFVKGASSVGSSGSRETSSLSVYEQNRRAAQGG